MAEGFEQLNNDVFMQLQDVLVHQIDDEISGTEPIDITRMLDSKLASIQMKIAEKLAKAE